FSAQLSTGSAWFRPGGGAPRKDEGAADDAEQHPDDEPAEVGGHESHQSQQETDDAEEHVLRGLEPAQHAEPDQQQADEGAGDTRDAGVDDQVDRQDEALCRGGDQDLDPCDGQEEPAPERAATPPGAETFLSFTEP